MIKLLIMLLLSSILFGDILITNEKSHYNDFSIEYHYDKSKKLTIDTIQNQTFIKNSNRFTFGYREGTVWFKLRLKNSSDAQDFVLCFDEAIWSNFNIFREKNGVWKKDANGLNVALRNRSIEDVKPSFDLHIEKGQTKIIYIQADTIASQIGMFKLCSAKEYYSPSRKSITNIYILFAFTLLSIVIINSYSFFLTRDNNYLYYIAYTVATIVFSSMHSGSYLLLGFDGWSEGLHVVGAFVILFLLLFSDKFLNLKEELPSIHKFFMLSIVVFLLFAVLIFSNVAYSSMFFNIYSALFFGVLFFATIKIFMQGSVSAKYYLIALIIYAPLMGLMIATFNGFIDYTPYNRHLFLLGAFIEIIFFTLILTSKYRSLNVQKINLQKELLEEKDKNEQFLESEIIKRTHKINQQNKKFETIYKTLKDGLAILDVKSTKFLEVNSAYADMLGYDIEELLNQSCLGLTHHDDKEKSIEAIKEIKESGFITDFEKSCIKKDGSLIFVNMATTLMSGGETMLISVRDVTKKRELISELETSQKELKLLASVDSMTQLYNRRYFTEMSQTICSLAKRNKTSLSILMLDIDKFKNINDTFGHDIGDIVIITLAKTLKKATRQSDIVTRWGGEEFLILLSDTDKNGASVIAQKILEEVRELRVSTQNDKTIQFTISVGVCEVIKEKDNSIELSITQADRALYKAKESGRDRVCII